MYIILNSIGKTPYSTFNDAFLTQQKHYPENKIIYSENGIIEIVWDPKWENINCEKI